MEDARQKTGRSKPELGQKHYVLDAGVLELYPDIIPGSDTNQPLNPLVNLAGTHLIVTTDVIQTLSSSHNTNTQATLRRLREIMEENADKNTSSVATAAVGSNTISVVNSSGDYGELLDIAESHGWREPITLLTNNDAQAIQALSQGLLTSRYNYRLPEPYTGRRELTVPNAIFTDFWNYQSVERVEFEKRMPNQRKLMPNEFVIMHPAEPEKLPFADEVKDDQFFRNIARYDAERDCLVGLRYIEGFPVTLKNPGQAIYAEALSNPDIAAVICTGPAGSGKTFISTVFGYEACKDGKYLGVTVIPCENRSNIGALPGGLDEKMDPNVQPMKNALRNYLLGRRDYQRDLATIRRHGNSEVIDDPDRLPPEEDDSSPDDVQKSVRAKGKSKKKGKTCDKDGKNSRNAKKTPLRARLDDNVELIWGNWFTNIPVEVARGRDFAHEVAIYDEAQDQTSTQMDTLIKRLGADGKIVITGDIDQIHNPKLTREDNGLVYASWLLGGSALVAEVHFTPDEVIRHPLVREVVERQTGA